MWSTRAEELAKPRENPFGPTNGDLKYGLEFEQEEYEEISAFCKSVKMLWFASPWDEASVDFLEQFDVPVHKIASASLTDDNLLRHVRATGKPVILSTGMSTYAEIDHAVEILGKDDLVLMHATSTYPAFYPELNLRAIPTMAERYAVPIGYSGHETGIPTSVCAAVLGACCCRAPHHDGSLDVGFRSCGLAGTERHLAPGARYTAVGAVQRRRHQACLRARVSHHQETAPRRRPRFSRMALEIPQPLAWRRSRPWPSTLTACSADGGLWWGPGGEEWKRFCFADIMGVSLARRAGLILALISGENSPLVDRYAEKMHISHVIKGCRDKAAALREFAAAAHVDLREALLYG